MRSTGCSSPRDVGRRARSAARRLFFALWPDEPLRRDAAARVAALGASGTRSAAAADQLHVTLVFLGMVAEARIDNVRAVAASLAGSAFTLMLDRLEHWRRPQVLCLTASAIPAPLATLVEQLRAALGEPAFRPSRVRTVRT